MPGNNSQGGGRGIISVHCQSCGADFRVRMPDIQPGRPGSIRYSCPRCGKTYTISNGPSSRSGRPGPAGGDLMRILKIVCIVLLAIFAVSAIKAVVVDRQSISGFLGTWGSGILGRITGRGDFTMLLARIFILFVCFPLHESAHAWTADRLGDHTGRQQGRITLNPLKHLDLWGTLTIFLFGVGFAKPVPVNINNFKNKKLDFAITALAGPISNLLMALILLLLLRIAGPAIGNTENGAMLFQFLLYASFINVSLAVFNLIPIPPLDGSRVLTAILPDQLYDKVLQYERYSMMILFVGLMLLSRMGISPVGALAGRVFEWMYRLVLLS